MILEISHRASFSVISLVLYLYCFHPMSAIAQTNIRKKEKAGRGNIYDYDSFEFKLVRKCEQFDDQV